MSTPPPVSPTVLPAFARHAATTFAALARAAAALGTPGGTALADLLAAGTAELTALAADPAVSGIPVILVPTPQDAATAGLAALLVTPVLLQESLAVALTAYAVSPAAAAGDPSRLLKATMLAARRLAALRIAAALAAAEQLQALDSSLFDVAGPGVARSDVAGPDVAVPDVPAAAGAVGTPDAYAPVVVA